MSLLIDAIALKHGLRKSFVEKAWRAAKKDVSEKGQKGNYSACVESLKDRLGLSSSIGLPQKNVLANLDNFKLNILESNPNVTLCSVTDCPEEFKQYLGEDSKLLIRSSDLVETTSSGSVAGSGAYSTIQPKKKKKKKGSEVTGIFSDDMLEKELESLGDCSDSSTRINECGFCNHSDCICESAVHYMTEKVDFNNSLTPDDLDLVYDSIGTGNSEETVDSGDALPLEEPPQILRNEEGDAGNFSSTSSAPSLDSGEDVSTDVSVETEDGGDLSDLEPNTEEETEEEATLETEEPDENRESIVYAESKDKKDSRMKDIHETLFGAGKTKKVDFKAPTRSRKMVEKKVAPLTNPVTHGKLNEKDSSQASRITDFFNNI